MIVAVAILGTGGALGFAFNATPIYRATAIIAPPQQKQSPAASAALTAFGGLEAEVAGSVRFSLGTNDVNRLEQLLESHRLIKRVVTRNALLPVLFPKSWDPESESWQRGATPPTVWDADAEFREAFRVLKSPKAGVLALSVEFIKPEQAEQILNMMLAELALIIQEDELHRIASNTKFAQSQLKTASDPVIKSRLQGILSEQIQRAMMAQNIGSFAYEVIDPPAASDKQVRPKKFRILIFGFVASTLLGAFATVLTERLSWDKCDRRDTASTA